MGKAGSFSERLRSLREAAGISQYRLAQLTGLSKQAISRLESGESQPAWETVQRLASALGVDFGAFADQNLVLPVPHEPGHAGRPRKDGKKEPAKPKHRRIKSA